MPVYCDLLTCVDYDRDVGYFHVLDWYMWKASRRLRKTPLPGHASHLRFSPADWSQQ